MLLKSSLASPVVYKRICVECKREFNTTHPTEKYCSVMCCYKYNQRIKQEQCASEYVPRTFICKECGMGVTTSRGDARSIFCSDKCMNRFLNRVAKKKRSELMKSLFIRPVSFKKIYKRDRGVCKICGLPVAYDKSPEKIWAATIDHIIPLSLGGTHEPGNCQLAHRLCNSLKLQETESFEIDWDQMREKDSERWSAAIGEYMEYMDAYRRGGHFSVYY